MDIQNGVFSLCFRKISKFPVFFLQGSIFVVNFLNSFPSTLGSLNHVTGREGEELDCYHRVLPPLDQTECDMETNLIRRRPLARLKNRKIGNDKSSPGPLILAETLYHRDNALLYIAYVMLIWAAPIPADRWHCSLWP